MKAIVLATALAALTASPALAADGVAAQAPAPAPPQAAAKLSVDTPIGDLIADPRSKAVLEARLPGIEKHPLYEMVKAMSLRQIQPFSEGRISEQMLSEIDKDLAAIK
jgi:opacity protein-like surface antigen